MIDIGDQWYLLTSKFVYKLNENLSGTMWNPQFQSKIIICKWNAFNFQSQLQHLAGLPTTFQDWQVYRVAKVN